MRVSFEDGLKLFHAPLEELQEKAVAIRQAKFPADQVTFIVDSNPNYTNICNIDCSFCAFYRHKNAKDSYTKSIEEVMLHFDKAKKIGITTVLLQGGVNPELPLEYYLTLVHEAIKRYPDIHPHFFTAVELVECAKNNKLPLQEVLEKLWEAGLRTIPGGGAEILSERVRKIVSPKKLENDGWIAFHKKAHEIGFRTTATMMYGHVEEPIDILHHLETLRQAQDLIPGFTAFIPWSYKRNRTLLRRKVHNWAGEEAYLRIIAFSRIYLDNIDHIQASWFGEGKKIGTKALHYGADDFGGTIYEESVHKATGWDANSSKEEMIEMIESAGFRAVQRINPLYDLLFSQECLAYN